MRRRLFLSILAAMALGSWLNITPATAAEFIVEPFDYDFPVEIQAAADENKNLVIMFHQSGCPYCDKMRQRVYPHPKVGALYNEKFTLIEVNMKGSLDVITHAGVSKTEKEFAAEMRVRATPMFVFFDKQADVALRLVGYQDPEMFLAAGRYVSSEAHKDGTSFISFVRAGK